MTIRGVPSWNGGVRSRSSKQKDQGLFHPLRWLLNLKNPQRQDANPIQQTSIMRLQPRIITIPLRPATGIGKANQLQTKPKLKQILASSNTTALIIIESKSLVTLTVHHGEQQRYCPRICQRQCCHLAPRCPFPCGKEPMAIPWTGSCLLSVQQRKRRHQRKSTSQRILQRKSPSPSKPSFSLPHLVLEKTSPVMRQGVAVNSSVGSLQYDGNQDVMGCPDAGGALNGPPVPDPPWFPEPK